MKQIIYLGFFLALVSAIAGLALSYTYVSTAPRIAAEAEKKLNTALTEVFSEADNFKKLSEETFEAQKQGKKIGLVSKVAPAGYGGAIQMLVGVDQNKKVTGVKILSLTETPGLGTNATNPDFLKQFVGKSTQDKIMPKDDIDAITGATITTQAVCDGVKKALANQDK